MRTRFVFCCLLHVALAKKIEISIEGLEGGEVAFQCSHKLASAYNKYFCKDSCRTSGDVLATVESGRQTASGRINLVDWRNGTFTVTFRYLQLSDSGMYWCAVDRPGFDTYTSINLTVHKVATTNVPVVSSTWSQNIFNTTRLTRGTKTNRQTKLITVTNSTTGFEQKTEQGHILYAVLGTVGALIILILAMVFKKRRETAKPQPPIFFNNKDPDNVHIKKMCWPHQEQDPIPSTNNSSVSLHVYENITFSEGNKGSRDPPAGQQSQDTPSKIYITLLPSAAPERTADDSKHTIKSTGNESPVTTEISAPPCVATKETPASLWFGLDITKINQS